MRISRKTTELFTPEYGTAFVHCVNRRMDLLKNMWWGKLQSYSELYNNIHVNFGDMCALMLRIHIHSVRSHIFTFIYVKEMVFALCAAGVKGINAPNLIGFGKFIILFFRFFFFFGKLLFGNTDILW